MNNTVPVTSVLQLGVVGVVLIFHHHKLVGPMLRFVEWLPHFAGP